jgi:hypothetical protein
MSAMADTRSRRARSYGHSIAVLRKASMISSTPKRSPMPVLVNRNDLKGLSLRNPKNTVSPAPQHAASASATQSHLACS